MVISFSVPEARNQLLNDGEVFTYRWKKRKNVGNNWANSGRGTKKIGDVWICEYFQAEPNLSLAPYQHKSGFKSLEDWQQRIQDMKPRNQDDPGWLYHVILYPKE